MKRSFLVILAVAGVLAAATATGPSAADNVIGAAYTITNSPIGNAVAVYTRASDGSLTPAGSVATGGLGTGSGLESQGAVGITEDGQTVLAVNPGSNTVSALAVEADGLRLNGSAPSGGIGPVSVTDGTVSTISAPIETGERDACWLVASNNGRFAFVANAASRSISTFAIAPDGSLAHLSVQPVAGTTALDEALSRDSRFLYVLAGDRIVGYEIGVDGSLTLVGAQTDVATTAAGLAAR